MTVRRISFFAQSLGRKVNYSISLPSDGGEVPAVYLLHGLGDDDRSFWKMTSLEEKAAELGFALVTPDLEGGWCCNDPRPGGDLWEDFITQDLISEVEACYPVKKSPAGRGLVGFSMGGYGSIMLALKHPGLFGVVVSLSGSYHFGHKYRTDRPERAAFMKAVAPPGGKYDLYALAENDADCADVPPLLLEVGREDHLLQANRELHDHFNKHGFNHEYHEGEGAHTWTWVDSRLESTLDFLTQNLDS